MIERFRLWPLRRELLTLSLVVLLAPIAAAQCPIAANCTPGPASDPNAPLFGRGITQVTLNTLNRTTPIGDGYQDSSCVIGGSTTLLVGNSYPLTVRTAPGGLENVRVWADFDNNGIFNPTTELVLSSNAAALHTGTLTVPAGAVLNTALRLRVAADDESSPIPTPCSTPQYSQVEDYAITIQTNTAPPTAAITAGADTVTCSGLVQFTDQSSGAPTSWLWNFGDNTTSTQQNPQHQYTAPGTYSVTLIVTNANGTDTLTLPNYIRYDTLAPIAASCTPQTAAYCCGYGIGRVRLANLDRASGNASAGYEDFTCGLRANVIGGNTYELRINRTGTLAQDIRVWLDLNNDGTFTSGELLLTALAQDSVVAQVTIPLTAPLNTPLRMRIIADAAGRPGGPCVAPQLGQAEDYAVIVQANTLPPAAAFNVAANTPCDSTKTFTDRTQNAPTSWLWYFGDGTTSTLQNPTHTYNQSGSYTVSLVTTNAFGTDSIAIADAVLVTLPCRNYCVPTNLQTVSVWISQVRLAQINRTSGLDPGGYVAIYDSPARLLQGQSDSLIVASTITGGGGAGGANFTTSVWIDFDQSGTWDTGERVMQQQSGQQQNTPVTVTLRDLITVPGNAPSGPTMMRVLSTRNGGLANNPCPPNGAPGVEIEDYVVIISSQQAAPGPSFIVDSVSCNGLVEFTDNSSNSPTSWTWDFGDGTTSTQQNPSHQYPTTPGVYTVTLAVSNAFGSDTLIRTAAVRVTGDPVPVAPACRPASVSPGFGLGIDSVAVQALGQTVLANSSPTADDGYRDYTCGSQGKVYRGEPVTLRVRTIQPMGARVLAWIDYNNDGDFNPVTERVMNSNNPQGGVHRMTFTVPITAVVNVPLRLRVGSDWTNNPVLRPCGAASPNPQPEFGQMEDYTLFARDTVLAVRDTHAPLALAVVPNPTLDGRVVVRFSGDGTTAADGTSLTLTVRSVLGQVVARRTLTVRAGADANVDLSALARGVYVVQTDGPAAALRGTIRLIRE